MEKVCETSSRDGPVKSEVQKQGRDGNTQEARLPYYGAMVDRKDMEDYPTMEQWAGNKDPEDYLTSTARASV